MLGQKHSHKRRGVYHWAGVWSLSLSFPVECLSGKDAGRVCIERSGMGKYRHILFDTVLQVEGKGVAWILIFEMMWEDGNGYL